MSTPFFVQLQKVLPQHGLSRLGGAVTQSQTPWLKNLLIRRFISAYNINLDEAASANPDDYACFNDFFVRELKPEARSIDQTAALACPVDGTISQMTSISSNQMIQAKGHSYSTELLLADELATTAAAPAFENGLFTTIYLSPSDYHRVHMPCDGQLIETRYVPGKLYSVNQTTTTHLPELFARNERLVCLFETELGPLAYVMVGAMMVAGIESAWHGHYQPNPNGVVSQNFANNPIVLKRGDELGRFRFGSTVIMLLGKDAIGWLDELSEGTTVKMGQALTR